MRLLVFSLAAILLVVSPVWSQISDTLQYGSNVQYASGSMIQGDRLSLHEVASSLEVIFTRSFSTTVFLNKYDALRLAKAVRHAVQGYSQGNVQGIEISSTVVMDFAALPGVLPAPVNQPSPGLQTYYPSPQNFALVEYGDYHVYLSPGDVLRMQSDIKKIQARLK